MPKLVLLILAIVSMCISVVASKAKDVKTIYATVSVDIGVKEDVDNLLQMVSFNLHQHDIDLKIVKEPSENVLNLELTTSENEWIGGTSLYVKTLTPAIMTVNPLLYSQFDQAAQIPIIWNEPDMLQETTTFITAISLYSINACTLAEPYFDAAGKLLAIGTAQNWSYLNFYRGNCALGANDIEHTFEYFNNALYWNDGVPSFNAPTVNLTWMLLNYDENQLWSKADTSGVLLDPDFALTRIICVVDCTSDKESDLYSRRAQLYAIAERYSDAIADLTTAIELTPNNLNIHLLRGKMYLAQYEWDSALADYNKAIELDPTYADAYYERGVLYYSILQTGVELRTEAFDDFHRYLELAPDGDHAADALRYTAQIEKELEALNG